MMEVQMKFKMWKAALWLLLVGACATQNPPAYGIGVVHVDAVRGGQKVVTAGFQSSTYVMRSYPGATLRVYNAGTNVLATIYSDLALTVVTGSTLTADSSGYAKFYTNETQVDIEFSGAGIPTHRRTYVTVPALANYITQAAADVSYLKLDTGNDPLTDSLIIDKTTAGTTTLTLKAGTLGGTYDYYSGLLMDNYSNSTTSRGWQILTGTVGVSPVDNKFKLYQSARNGGGSILTEVLSIDPTTLASTWAAGLTASSGTFTTSSLGTAVATTPGAGDNDTSVATTAFVQSEAISQTEADSRYLKLAADNDPLTSELTVAAAGIGATGDVVNFTDPVSGTVAAFESSGVGANTVSGIASGAGGRAVRGWAQTSGSFGVHGESTAPNGYGVYGYANGTTTVGVYGVADGTNAPDGYAIRAVKNGTVGVSNPALEATSGATTSGHFKSQTASNLASTVVISEHTSGQTANTLMLDIRDQSNSAVASIDAEGDAAFISVATGAGSASAPAVRLAANPDTGMFFSSSTVAVSSDTNTVAEFLMPATGNAANSRLYGLTKSWTAQKMLTETTATDFVSINVYQSPAAMASYTAGRVEYVIFAGDAAERQARAGSFNFVAVNKAGVETCTLSAVDSEIVAVSSGTLTVSFTCTTTPVEGIMLQANATSSLAQTQLGIDYGVHVFGGAVMEATKQ